MEIIKGRIIYADGRVGVVDLSNMGEDQQLTQLQTLVGGYIEPIYFTAPNGKRYECYVNEDGISLQLPVNLNATLLLERPIVGDMVVITEGVIS